MSVKLITHLLAMVRVTDVEDEEAPTVLLVDNNQMSLHRLTNIFRQREFNVVTCDDGDKAVDEYIRLDPELVVLALDIPSMDGHLAALEMREHGKDCRILFSAPKRQAELAQDATHSAGAIGWVEKPITASAIDSIWDLVLGPIPEAPGLEDLDTIHPVEEMIEVEEDEGPMPIPAPLPLPINPLPIEETVQPKKKSSKAKRLLFVLVIFTGLGAAGWYAWTNGLI
ncbi:MAG TPA: response regulator [Candidatus Poseidoniales archaeon]|jgi:CheY-like chemotaxis protein|nr:MAG TPA: response regulator [Candidatus Poseidoniales archaeon]HIH57553.1 response regulator [Candidatus Poseidoniaceae archaeon]|tara:strand:- start:51 stop:728 length:678 start_codon:yes stop_codon:yes gene_type:complete